MNKGLSKTLIDAFPNFSPVERPSVLDFKIPDPN
jgi:hypothetical protein